VKFGFGPPLFSCSNHVARSIRVFDDGSDMRGRLSMLLWGAASLFVSALELRSWHRYPPSPCRLRSAIWSRFFLLVVFLRVLSIVACPALVNCLLRSHHHDVAGDVTIGASAFSLKKNAFMLNQNLYLYHTC